MLRSFVLLMAGLFFYMNVSAQCPYIAGIMVDACGQENRNEFVFLLNGGTALNVNDLEIVFPNNGSVTVANTNDFTTPSVTSATHIGGCLTLLNNGGVIPANAPVIIFMSSDVEQQYDFSSWCTEYGTVYLLYRNITPALPTYANNTSSGGGPTRTTTLRIGDPATCVAEFTYTLPVTSADGDFYRFDDPVLGVSISPGAVNNGCASPPHQILPVKLKSFAARLNNQSVILNWITTMEEAFSHFDIERSTNGIAFGKIGQVQADRQTTGERTYTYTDQSLISKTLYYRLKMADINGDYEYSRIVSVNIGETATTIISQYFDQSSQALNVEWNTAQKSNGYITIADMYGRNVYHKQILSEKGYNKVRVDDLRTLAKGSYVFRLILDKEAFTGKFIK